MVCRLFRDSIFRRQDWLLTPAYASNASLIYTGAILRRCVVDFLFIKSTGKRHRRPRVACHYNGSLRFLLPASRAKPVCRNSCLRRCGCCHYLRRTFNRPLWLSLAQSAARRACMRSGACGIVFCGFTGRKADLAALSHLFDAEL